MPCHRPLSGSQVTATPFNFAVADENGAHQKKLKAAANRLHPTPSAAGMPKLQRTWAAAFLGFVNVRKAKRIQEARGKPAALPTSAPSLTIPFQEFEILVFLRQFPTSPSRFLYSDIHW